MPTLFKTVFGFFFDHKFGGLAAGLLAMLGLVGAYQLNNAHQRGKGAANAVNNLNSQARKLAAEARQARRAADAPGAAERLRQHYCSNC